MDRKVKRFLETTFLGYRLKDDKINGIIEFISRFEFSKYAEEVKQSLFDYLEDKIEEEL